jgi:hypothetical protein
LFISFAKETCETKIQEDGGGLNDCFVQVRDLANDLHGLALIEVKGGDNICLRDADAASCLAVKDLEAVRR